MALTSLVPRPEASPAGRPLSIAPGSAREATPVTQRLEGKPVADQLNESTRAAISTRGSRRPPSLVSVHRDVDSPFRFYLKRQAKAAADVGVAFRDEGVGDAAHPAALTARLSALAVDAGVDAVLVEHPLPPPFDFGSAVGQLTLAKDVDGVSSGSLGRLVTQRPVHVPAVALAAVAIAQHYRVPLEGAPVAVLGRSETVGLPLALLLASRGAGLNATVTVVHSRTRDLRAALSGAATIFSCVGHPGLLRRAVVPEGAHLIDIGLSSVPDPTRPGGSRSAGDADAAEMDGWAASLTPVPGGVGPVTVAQLMASATKAWQWSQSGEVPP